MEIQIAKIDQLLDITDRSRRMAILDSHILNVLKREAKIPLFQTLIVTEEWLRIYEKLLLHTAVK